MPFSLFRALSFQYFTMFLGPLLPILAATAFVAPATSLTPAGWRSQSIYQVMTDRFARTDLSTTAACDSSQGVYCGGTWKGLISKLDYIQGMGFTAIWISPFVEQMSGDTTDGSSYHVRNQRCRLLYKLSSSYCLVSLLGLKRKETKPGSLSTYVFP